MARARLLAAELARRGIDITTEDKLREFLDLLDPDGDDEELVEEVAEWIDALNASAEAGHFATAVIEKARGVSTLRTKSS